MAIENRSLEPGTRLVARYKGQTYHAVVGSEGTILLEGPAVSQEGGGTLIEYRSFQSLSGAGSAVMGGNACNGWRFWSLEGDAPAATATPTEQPVRKGFKLIKRTPNQKGLEEGQVRWFCSACMKGFVAAAGEEPSACPEGHGAGDPELLAVVGA